MFSWWLRDIYILKTESEVFAHLKSYQRLLHSRLLNYNTGIKDYWSAWLWHLWLSALKIKGIQKLDFNNNGIHDLQDFCHAWLLISKTIPDYWRPSVHAECAGLSKPSIFRCWTLVRHGHLVRATTGLVARPAEEASDSQRPEIKASVHDTKSEDKGGYSSHYPCTSCIWNNCSRATRPSTTNNERLGY